MPAVSNEVFFTSEKKSMMPDTSSAPARTISTMPTTTDTRSCACSSSQALASTARARPSSLPSGKGISFACGNRRET